MDGNAQVKEFIDRILRLKEEQDALASDIREVYAEAKSSGFDKTALGEVVSYLRKIEKKGKDAVSERTAMFDLYLVAYEGPSHTHAREAAQSYAEAKGRAGVAEEISNPKGSGVFISAFSVAEVKGREFPNPYPQLTEDEIKELRRLGPGELTQTQEQPETANEIHERPSINAEAYPEAGPQAEASPAGTGTGTLAGHEGRSEGEAASAGLPTNSPSAADSLPGAVKAPEADSLPASGAVLSEADVPAFLRKTIADFRPNCLHPDTCAASGLRHCNACTRAMEAAEMENA